MRLDSMPLSLPIPRSRRGRRTVAVAAATAVLAGVVLANQTRGASSPAAAAPRVAAAVARQVPTAATPATSGLRVLSVHYRFRDVSVLHHGAPPLSAATAILIDPDRGTILFALHPHEVRAPASTTKIDTAIVALENLDPGRRVDITADALNQAGDETRMGIAAGDHYTVAELLQGMLMVSGNDAATAIAADTVGLKRFVLGMNEQVDALGLQDTSFTTPVGLDDPGQRSSAYDLAVLGLAAWDAFPVFRTIVATRDLDIPATSGHNAYHLHNLSRLLEAYPAAVGIKTGFTGDAGYCLVAMAVRGGHRLLSVVMDDGHMVDDSHALLDWGFAQEYHLPPLQTPSPSPKPAH